MIDIFIAALVVVLSAMGLADLMHRIYIRFIAPETTEKYIFLLMKAGDSVNAVSAALDELRWYGREYAEGVICVDNGLDSTEKELISKIAASNEKLLFCQMKDIEKIL